MATQRQAGERTLTSFGELGEARESLDLESPGKVKEAFKKLNFWKDMSKTQRRLVLGAAGAAVLFGVSRVPVIRTVALPLAATALSKNFGALRSALKV